MSSLLSSANIITHFPVIGEREKSVSVLSWRVELELESGMFRSSVLSWRDELELESRVGVGVGERNCRFENLMRNTVVCLTL